MYQVTSGIVGLVGVLGLTLGLAVWASVNKKRVKTP